MLSVFHYNNFFNDAFQGDAVIRCPAAFAMLVLISYNKVFAQVKYHKVSIPSLLNLASFKTIDFRRFFREY